MCACMQAARELNPLVKNASEAAALAERAWLLSVLAAAKGAAAGKFRPFIVTRGRGQGGVGRLRGEGWGG